MNLGKNILSPKICQGLLKQSCTRLLCCYNAKILPLRFQASNEICAVHHRPVKVSTVPYSSVLSDPENKGSHQKGVNFDTLGSWNNRLDMPILVDKSIEKGKLIPRIPLEEVGTASLIGRRKVNEDRWIVKQLTPDILYFGIFDGHGGLDVVDYACQHMEEHLCFELTQTNDLSKVLDHAFVNLNNVIARHLAYYNTDQDLNMMGTTATVCLLRNSIELVVGNVGDSRAVLSREGHAKRLSLAGIYPGLFLVPKSKSYTRDTPEIQLSILNPFIHIKRFIIEGGFLEKDFTAGIDLVRIMVISGPAPWLRRLTTW